MGGNTILKLLKNNKGSVIVEVAVMFMIVTMMATGYLYFTQSMRINTTLKIAAKEGAREYSVTNNPSKARSRVKSELLLAGIDPSGVDISITSSGKKRIVNVRARHGFYAPFAGEYDLNLRGGAEYILENNPEIEEKGQL
jgi:uncharacterized protein (UPF0333 family)